MGRMSIDIPTTLKKMEPKTGSLRRTSTGNSIMKTNEPNNLRVSTGPSHDISKPDIKRAPAVKPWRPVGRILDKNVDISMDKDRKGIKALTSPHKAMSSVFSRQHLSELPKPKSFKTDAFSRTLDKNASLDKDQRGKKALASVSSSKTKTCKPVTISHQPPAPKQSIRTLLARDSQNDAAAGKEVKNPMKSNPSQNDAAAGKEVKNPMKSNPKLLPTAKSRTDKKDSQPEIKSKTCNVPEKVIHAIEPQDDESHINCTALPNEESDNRKKGTEEKCSSPPKKMTKLMNRSGKVSPVKENIGNARSLLRRSPVSEGKAVNQKQTNESIGGGGGVLRHEYAGWKNGDSVLLNIVIEERASNLVKMRKSKVEALVGAFQSVITKTQHSSSS